MNWYRISQQLTFPFNEPVPSEEEWGESEKSVDHLEYILDDKKGFHEIADTLGKHGYKWRKITFPEDIFIMVDDNKWMITDLEYPSISISCPVEWIYGLSDLDMYHYMPIDLREKFEIDFWKNVSQNYKVYHGTTKDGLDLILFEGIKQQNKTRGLTNLGTPSAIFTSDNPDEPLYSYEKVVEINVGQMKSDGYMPNVSREDPVDEAETREMLAHKIGLENMNFSDGLYSDGISDSTIIFYDNIPPKYIREYV